MTVGGVPLCVCVGNTEFENEWLPLLLSTLILWGRVSHLTWTRWFAKLAGHVPRRSIYFYLSPFTKAGFSSLFSYKLCGGDTKSGPYTCIIYTCARDPSPNLPRIRLFDHRIITSFPSPLSFLQSLFFTLFSLKCMPSL